MAKAIISVLSELPEEAVKTITCDRGSEFACWREIEKSVAMRSVFCRSVLCLAERSKAKSERVAQRILPQGQKPVKGKSRDIEKEPGALKRQARKSFAFQNTERFIPEKSYQVLHLV